MADAEHWQPEVEEGGEAGLKAIATIDALPDNGIASAVSSKEVADGNDLDKNGDAHVEDILEFDDIGSNVNGITNGSESSTSQVESRESSRNGGEVVEEEIVELEFEKVKPKLTTHSMHCPNCKSEITKVVLRRKVFITNRSQPEPEPEPEPNPGLIVGCLACLSLFTCSDDGCFNPFNIFRPRPDTTTSLASSPPAGEKGNGSGSCFSMFWVLRKEKTNPIPNNPQQSEPVNPHSIISPEQAEEPVKSIITRDQVQEPLYVNRQSVISPGLLQSHTFVPGTTSNTVKVSSEGPSLDIHESPKIDDAIIHVDDAGETISVAQPRGRPWLGSDGILLEILKSIVYGGLMEVIASLSVVASAAASDAATLSIVSLALASLAGGIFVIGHNLWDLRDDCYKENSSQESNNEATTKYKEVLGQVSYFPLHAFFAILSFVVFGMVPPVAYGYSFHETNDKDYTVIVVAIASLVCVSLLAIFKAYINKCTFLEYFKTVVYYITTAVSVSGVSYVAGNLITKLIEEYGFFDMNSGGGMSLFPHATISSLASV
ncbi:putative Ccc1 family protein [Helianthus annuus]|nr:putative Ccc1 family protein [Helianthus annuus]